MEAERKYMDKKAEAMTKKCFDGLFQIWEKMGSENLRKDKVDYILKNFEDILEIYVIIEKKNMEKMKKNIQELHLRRRQLHIDLGKIISFFRSYFNIRYRRAGFQYFFFVKPK